MSIKNLPCNKCGAVIKSYWLKNGTCNACLNPHLVVTNAETYNGWKNYETWNVALWIQNDEGLYGLAKSFKRLGYKRFAESMTGLDGAIAFQTPDGVAWNDSALDIEALDEMLGEL